MIVVYHDIGGTHSTAIAANIHTNKLPIDKFPDKNEILSLPTFDKIKKKDQGHLIYIGIDEFGAKVFTLSRQYKPNLVIPAIIDMYSTCSGGSSDLYVIDTMSTVNFLMKIGGFASRRMGLVTLGRPLVTKGSLKTYFNIAEIVRQVKEKIQQDITMH